MRLNLPRKWLGLLIAGITFLPTAGSAGDFAERSALGFSPDGRYFAFEEYGVQDGSGLPYSNIFLVDTSRDEWVEGTPIRVQPENDSQSLSQIRAESRDQFGSFLTTYQIGAEGMTVVSNPLTETSANPYFVSFFPQFSVLNADGDYKLALQEYQLPAANCPDSGQAYKGFQLTLTEPDGGERVLSRDERIPGSRKCPLGYRLSEVITYFPANGQPILTVVISIFSLGFEGPDRRFIAVTGAL